uniref:Uncharacterized protein n=1 Tax=Lepeophtheirus salmonis TaxID=72036 RepID=A0A0K2U0D8_LEPSM
MKCFEKETFAFSSKGLKTPSLNVYCIWFSLRILFFSICFYCVQTGVVLDACLLLHTNKSPFQWNLVLFLCVRWR